MKHFKVLLIFLMLFAVLKANAQENVTGESGSTTPSTSGTGNSSTGSGSVSIQQDQRLQNIVSGNTQVVERPSNEGGQRGESNPANRPANRPAPSQPRRVQRTQVVPVNQLPQFGNNNNVDVRRGTRKRMRGFRIQMYWGNSLRTDRLKAQRIADKVSGAFPELKAYVSYDQPHWRCRVGDFKTRAGAARYLDRMRKIAPEAMIVRSEIYIYQ